MGYLLTVLVVALTALTWLIYVTVAPGSDFAEPLQFAASFLTAVSGARLVEFLVGRAIGVDQDHRKTTDLVRVISSIFIYVAALIAWLYYGLGFNVTSLLATSAVLTVVIGLALQSTLGNLFSGLALELERPVHVGDYMRRSPVEGTVEALKWRSIFLRASNGSLIVVPNSGLSANHVEIFPAHLPTYHTIAFHVPTLYPPNIVQDVMRAALNAGGIHASILKDPAPKALLLGSEPERGAFRYGARIYTLKPGELTSIFSAVLTRMWYALDRHGIPMTSIAEQGDNAPQVPLGAFRFKPGVVPAQLLAAGRLLRYGPGELIGPEIAGILVEGMAQEDMLPGELDIDATLAAMAQGHSVDPHKAHLSASVQAEIAKHAAPFLGPVASTLADRYGALTEDPFLVYRAVATHIQPDKERARFLASAPARPIRRVLPGEPLGWSGLLGLEPPGGRRRLVPNEAALLAFTREQLKAVLAGEQSEALIALLDRAPALDEIAPQDWRARLERLAG